MTFDIWPFIQFVLSILSLVEIVDISASTAVLPMVFLYSTALTFYHRYFTRISFSNFLYFSPSKWKFHYEPNNIG